MYIGHTVFTRECDSQCQFLVVSVVFVGLDLCLKQHNNYICIVIHVPKQQNHICNIIV